MTQTTREGETSSIDPIRTLREVKTYYLFQINDHLPSVFNMTDALNIRLIVEKRSEAMSGGFASIDGFVVGLL